MYCRMVVVLSKDNWDTYTDLSWVSVTRVAHARRPLRLCFAFRVALHFIVIRKWYYNCSQIYCLRGGGEETRGAHNTHPHSS